MNVGTYTKIWMANTEPNTKRNSNHSVFMAGSLATLKRLALVCGLDVVEERYYSQAFGMWHTQWNMINQDGKQKGFIKPWRNGEYTMLMYHDDITISGDEFWSIINNN